MRKLKLSVTIGFLVILLGSAIFSIIYFNRKVTSAKVVTTIFPIYDMCREIMGSDDDIKLLEDSGSDMHSYNPTASDITVIAKSELFIFIGGESDEWVGNVIRTVNSVNLRTLSLMNEIEKLEESDEGILDEHGHEHGSTENSEVEYDEHIWLSLKNAKKMVRAIETSLIQVFPERQKLIETNADEYVTKIDVLESEYSQALGVATKPLIIADRFPFRYLVNDYNLSYHAVFSGCSAETEASTETIAQLITKINENDINYVLVLESSDKSIANSAIHNSNCKSGVKVLVLDSCQSIDRRNLSELSYLDIMANNLEILKKVIR